MSNTAPSAHVRHCLEYDYEFSVWPHDRGWESAVYEVFRHFPRICLTAAENQFCVLQDSLERSGFTLRETTRVPHYEPEPVNYGRRTLSPELGPGGIPSAGSTPVLTRRSSSRRAALTAVPILASDSGRGLVTAFAR
jgi:hypothetical protein